MELPEGLLAESESLQGLLTKLRKCALPKTKLSQILLTKHAQSRLL